MRGHDLPPIAFSLVRVGFALIGMALIAAGTPVALLTTIVLIALVEGADFAAVCARGTASSRTIDAACVAFFHAAIFLAFMAAGWMPMWAVLAIYGCEITLPYLRSFATQLDAALPPPALERIKSAIQGISQIVVLGIVLVRGSRIGLGEVDAMLLIFSANVAMSLAVFLQNFTPLTKAKPR